jgi:hypothetical protein
MLKMKQELLAIFDILQGLWTIQIKHLKHYSRPISMANRLEMVSFQNKLVAISFKKNLHFFQNLHNFLL